MENEFIGLAEKAINKSKEITEKDIEAKFCKFASSKGCKAVKLVMLSLRGFPDRTIFCPKGRILFIEFKRKNKTQTALQIKVQRWIEKFGFEYYICDEMGQAEIILEDFLDGLL